MSGSGRLVRSVKRWVVFLHGGEFQWDGNIDAGYADLSSNIVEAAASGLGVLAVDFR